LSIRNLGQSNPAVAGAALQANASAEDIARLNALVEFQKIHTNLSAMSQNDAYAKFKSYKPETQQILSELYHPKYTQDDRGTIYNTARGVVNMVKSSVWYGGGTTKDIFKQVMNFTTGQLAINTAKTVGQYALTPVVAETNPVGRALNTALRPATKLIKQPYEAQVLYENATDNNFLKDWRTVADMYGQGITELLPGGKDINTNYQGGGWKQYWAQASDPKAIFDTTATAKFEKDLDPNVATVAKMLASGKDLVAEFDTYKNNPALTGLIAKWTGGDADTTAAIADAFSRYSKSKISPGRDLARDLISILPHEWEQAVMGDGKSRLLFTTISGPIDFGVTFGLDPLILAGKANKAALAFKYGMAKNGVTSADFARVVETRPQVATYFDNAGRLVDKYKNGAPEESALAYTELRNRYKELSPGLISDMSEFGVKDAKSTIQFFQGQTDITALTQGTAVMQRTVLYPRYTVFDSINNKVKDVANFMFNTKKFRNTGLPGATEDLSKVMSEDPVVWAEKLGVNQQFTTSPAGEKLQFFTERDRRISARVNRFVKAFEIAPKQERIIQISDASDADKIFAMSRAIGFDKTSASIVRRYWVGADEGQRLVVLTGVLKSMGRAMGLEYSEVGRRLYSAIDDLSKELYSVSQESVNLGELNATSGLVSAENLAAPAGIRKAAQEVLRISSAEGKANQVNASIVSEMKQNQADRKILALAKKQLKAQAKLGEDITEKLAMVDQQLGLLGARWAKLNKARVGVKGAITEGNIPADIDKFNAAEINGTQRAIRVYQLENARALPDLNAWRRASAKAGVLNKVIGGTSNNAAVQAVTDVWSFGNLFPRLGVRTSVEEVGTHLFINGAEGLSLYIKGREISRALRVNEVPGVKNKVLMKKGFLQEVETTSLGVLYNSIYKTLGKTKSKEELIALANDPERLAQAVAQSVLNNRFRPRFFNTAMGNRVSEYAADFARFDGKPIVEDILGSSYRAEMRLSDTEVASRSLEQFGPSIALNPNITEALKFHRFRGEYTQLASDSEGFQVNWLLELNNTVGKRNGQFGNIVLWNAHRPQGEVIGKLVDYIGTPEGAALAKRFAIHDEVGVQNFAERIYADATYALRDSAGRINNKLVNAIRDKGGMQEFTLSDLAKIDTPYARPKSILGKQLIPIESSNAPNIIRRVMDNGYGWIGKQIALLDREPITYGNYIMYREQFRAHQSAVEESLLKSGATPELAKNVAALSAHDMSLNLARNRTLAFVDNADIRTNLAFSLKTFGRYYRATEDFYRRAVRIGKYEPEALVRLAIVNQTFEDSGFVHQDDKGQLYFTYPGGGILDDILNSTLAKYLGISANIPLPVSYGGYVKMLTPSLDPQSAAPRIGGPVASLYIAAFEQLPFIGDFIKSYETAITGGFNPDQPLWRKTLPAQVLRLVDVAFGGDANIDARFNATIKSLRMLVSTGNGPEKPADVTKFMSDGATQATNILVTKLFLGAMAPASIQQFENRTLPSELIRSGAFTWNSEFIKFMNRYPKDPQAFSKALVDFATIYPSKLAFTVSATSAGTEANFQKTYDAAKFIKGNSKLFIEHKEGASFFIPINGTSDYQSYQYLKSNGFVKNKNLEDYVFQIATATARKTYYQISDDINAKIAASSDPTYKRFLRQDLQIKQQQLKKYFPLLATALSGGDQNKKINALNDLRDVVLSGKAPNAKLAKNFYTMIALYDDYVKKTTGLGSSNNDTNYKKFLKADLKDNLVTAAGTDPNAQSVYNTLLEPLIGE
jgi:hypothetical protein